MSTSFRWVSLVALSALASLPVHASSDHHWGYSGHGGPDHWGSLSDDFTVCSQGRNQSPINLSQALDAELAPLTVNYQAGGREILNNGHTVQVNYAPGSVLQLDGKRFELKQFHFHSPSENQIDGRSYPMEIHLVHADADGNLAVIGVMVEEGAANSALANAWRQLPAHSGPASALRNVLSAEALLPTARSYYRFNGSLTTPPCTEGVRWLVMEAPISASRQQIEQFSTLFPEGNNRPVQPLNARVLVQ